MDADQMLARIEGRLQRIEEIVRQLAAAHAEIGRALNATLFSQAIYLGDHRALTFLQNGQKIFVDTRSIDVGTHLLLDGRWEANYMAAFGRLLRPGHTVLDIGANHGVYALVAGKQVGAQGKVFAFEPNSQLCDLLRASVSVNGLDPVIQVVHCAVADTDGETVLAFDEHWAARGQIRPDVEGVSPRDDASRRSERVRCVALDSFLGGLGRSVDVVKMDVEGSEGLVLEGMKNLIERSPHLKIMMEFCPSMLAAFPRDAKFVIGFLEARRFMPWAIGDDGSTVPVSWPSLMEQPDRVRNILVSREAIA